MYCLGSGAYQVRSWLLQLCCVSLKYEPWLDQDQTTRLTDVAKGYQKYAIGPYPPFTGIAKTHRELRKFNYLPFFQQLVNLFAHL